MYRSLFLTCVASFLSFSLFAQTQPSVLIAYYSKSGNTKLMGEAVAKGARSVEGIEVILRSIEEVQSEELLQASAIILGSPVYNANVAPAVQEFINSWPFEGRPLGDKIGAAFTTGGGISIGEELAMLNILHSMLVYGMIVVGGEETEAAFGASAVTGEAPFDTGNLDGIFLKKGYGLGRRVAGLVKEHTGQR
jgi:NAD(P)H dehydrogenase (quinone)